MVRIGALQWRQRDVTSERTQTTPCTWHTARGGGTSRWGLTTGPVSPPGVSWEPRTGPALADWLPLHSSAHCSQHSVPLKVRSRPFQFSSLSISKVPIHLLYKILLFLKTTLITGKAYKQQSSFTRNSSENMTNTAVLFKYNRTLSKGQLILLLWFFFLLLFCPYNFAIIFCMEKNITLVSELK